MSGLNLNILTKLRPPTTKKTPRKSLVGQVFSRFTVFALMGHTRTQEAMSYWLCRCQCGSWRIVAKQKLTSGYTKSCGCYRNENAAQRSRTHGMSKTTVYDRWADMHTRCYNPKFKQYADYGGRGITVEERWHNFENFYSDIGEPPSRQHMLERRDNSKNYGPDNCYWATRTEQARNKRTTRWITINGQTKSLAEWLESSSVKQSVVWRRLQKGMTPEEAFGFKELAN